MTVKEYKEWMAVRDEESMAASETLKGKEMFCVGKAAAFKECYDKCPDFFEMDEEKTNREEKSRIQSITDKMENLKKQLKESKERADNGWERVRYLERRLRDVESLNDQLLRELARRQYKEETGE